MSRGTRVFLASGCGGGIGSLIALQLGFPLWWIGGLAGFLLGYLFYDLDELRKAIPKAWAKVTTWRLDKEEVALNSLLVLACISTLASALGLVFLFGLGFGLAYRTLSSGSADIFLGVFIVLGIICGVVIWVITLNRLGEQLGEPKNEGNDRKWFAAFLFYASPFAYLSYWPARGLIWLIKKIPEFAVLLAEFVKEVFILVHSELRLLCGIDAAIGAVTGYLLGNAIIGVFVGGLFGWLNYQIISVRILKIQPAKVRG